MKQIFLATVVLTALAAPIHAQISVGANVQVSKGYGNDPHFELLANADPRDPNRLIACSSIYPSGPNSTVVYSSFDGGRSWSATLGPKGLETSGDPVCTYGPNGDAYYVALKSVNGKGRTIIYKSTDGGKTWGAPLPLMGTDREFVVVDNTNSKYRGSIYINGTGFTRGISPQLKEWATDLTVLYSRDGVHWAASKRAELGNRYVLGMGNSVVLSDGTLLFTFGEIENYSSGTSPIASPKPGEPNAVLQVIRSDDGGETLEPAVTISPFYMDWPPTTTSVNPYLAVDLSTGPFKDRVYCVWPDKRSGRLEIHVSHSDDKGKTWSSPVVVNDDRPWSAPGRGPDALMPVIQVSKDGVVGVVYQDRRDNPDNQSYSVRFTASLDGGETWMPSAPVSSKPNLVGPRDNVALNVSPTLSLPRDTSTPPATASTGAIRPLTLSVNVNAFSFSGGHYAGMAMNASGSFHPVWIDNRTGVAQMWTAPVTVKGMAAKHGGGELATMKEVSDRVRLELWNPEYDRGRGTVTLTAALRNASRDTVRGPVKVRVVDVRSQLGNVVIPDAGPGIRGAGAIWDLSSLLANATLLPDSLSASRKLTFRINDIQPYRRAEGEEFRMQLIQVDVRVFAASVGEAKTTATQK
jgi:hypothetical protein